MLDTVSRLNASTVMVNDHTAFRVDWMPFGGRDVSGIGTGGIPYSMHEMTREKMIVFRRCKKSGAVTSATLSYPDCFPRIIVRFQKVTRLFTGSDGKSHFENLNSSCGDIGHLSDMVKATGVIFRETQYNYGWHNAPQRQYIVMLDGEVDIETGDGARRVFRTGDIILAEDITGQGHISRSVAGKPRKSLFITLD